MKFSCFGQDLESKICLTYPEFKFYANQVVECDGLKEDTANLNQQILRNDRIINFYQIKMENADTIIFNKDAEIDKYRISYVNLSAKYIKAEKKKVFYQKTTVIFIFTTLLFGSIMVIK